MNANQHDELAQLFAQSMQLQQSAAIPVVQQPLSEKQADSPIHFASAHYTPNTAHMRAETQSEPAQSPPPPYREALMPDAMADMLRQNSIDPSALLPNQVNLFLNADYEQRLRLLELWRISPPSYPHEQQMHQQWAQTSVEKEEHAARDRYEQQMQQRSARQEEHMFDTFVPEPSRMRSASISAGTVTIKPMEAEPYIVNGYEIAAASPRAVEPVYAAAGLWSAPSYEASVQQASMEDQYGMVEQIRCHADWERMNQQQFHGMHGPVGGDDSMDMEL